MSDQPTDTIPETDDPTPFSEREATAVASDLWAIRFNTGDEDLDDVLGSTVQQYTLTEVGLMLTFTVPESGRHPLELVRKLQGWHCIGMNPQYAVDYPFPVRLTLVTYRSNGAVAWIDRYGLWGIVGFMIHGCEPFDRERDGSADAQVLTATFKCQWIDPVVKPQPKIRAYTTPEAVPTAA